MISPYWNKNFFEFFHEFGKRLGGVLLGKIPAASDEIQIFTLSLLALSCALLGGFLQLRKMVMLANSLSHTILLGIVAAFLILTPNAVGDFGHHPISLAALFVASLATALITTFLTQFVTRSLKLQEDASIGLVFTGLFALGIVIVTLFTKNVHLGTEVVMGNPDLLLPGDFKMALYLAVANIALFTLFYRRFKMISFDENLAKTQGVSCTFFHYLLMVQLSATTIASFKAVGVVLVLAFLVSPFLIARRLTYRLKPLLVFASIAGILSAILGVALSRHFLSSYGWALSTGGIIVSLLVIFYLLAILFEFLRKKTKKIVFN